MAARKWLLVSRDGGDFKVGLIYDSETLAISTLGGRNNSLTKTGSVTIDHPNFTQPLSATFTPGQTRTLDISSHGLTMGYDDDWEGVFRDGIEVQASYG